MVMRLIQRVAVVVTLAMLMSPALLAQAAEDAAHTGPAARSTSSCPISTRATSSA